MNKEWEHAQENTNCNCAVWWRAAGFYLGLPKRWTDWRLSTYSVAIAHANIFNATKTQMLLAQKGRGKPPKSYPK